MHVAQARPSECSTLLLVIVRIIDSILSIDYSDYTRGSCLA